MNSERLLGIFLAVFIIGTAIYFTFTKFKQEINVSSSPSPSPSLALEFILTRTPQPTQTSPQAQQQAQSIPQPTPQELPLARVKRLAQFPGVLKDEILQNKKAVFITNRGTFEIEIYPDVPMASSNFLILASNGFYDGLKFHRVEKGFVVQGGDPLGDGTGGPGYNFPDEAVNREYKKGTVAYANSGPNTNGSQFFIMIEDKLDLPKRYTIFGAVISGQDVVEKLTVGDIMQKVTVQNLK